MGFRSVITDYITELLVKIIEFTQARQKILTQNINNVYHSEFVPKDLAVEEFSQTLNMAIDVHAPNDCLVFRDTKNVKFCVGGSVDAIPIVDRSAKQALAKSRDEYLEMQIEKIMENSLNQRLAAEFLRQREKTVLNL